MGAKAGAVADAGGWFYKSLPHQCVKFEKRFKLQLGGDGQEQAQGSHREMSQLAPRLGSVSLPGPSTTALHSGRDVAPGGERSCCRNF